MIEQVLAKFKDEPVEFVRQVLGAEPDAWQAEALTALATRDRVAIRSGHGVGKTALEAWSVCWFLFTRPFCKVPCTAPTIRQLYDILWSEISKWLKSSPLLAELFEWQKTKVSFKTAPERWQAIARTAARPENLAGFHDEHLLFILDEASGIDDAIFETVEGALTGKDNKLLICGNPTRNAGFFKRAFYEDRDLYYMLKVSSAESGRVSNEYCKRLIRQYGEDSDVVRVRVLGTESWFNLRDRFQSGEIILAVNDDVLTAQLSTRKYQLNSRGQFMLEQKADYKKSHKHSPDRADAKSVTQRLLTTTTAPKNKFEAAFRQQEHHRQEHRHLRRLRQGRRLCAVVPVTARLLRLFSGLWTFSAHILPAKNGLPLIKLNSPPPKMNIKNLSRRVTLKTISPNR